MNTLFVFGLGYAATAIGEILLGDGWKVAGTVRSEDRGAELAAKGFAPLLFEAKHRIAHALNGTTRLLLSVPPEERFDPVLKAYAPLISKIVPQLRWTGYLSTIGVYGDHGGAWVDEDTPVRPGAKRNWARIGAEQAWIDFSRTTRCPLDIFRLAGIYGPGRSPLARIAAGSAVRVIKPGQVFNRIHADDIARTVLAAMTSAGARGCPRIFNVCDDEPAPPQDVIALAARLIGAPLPPEVAIEDAALSPMARSFYDDNKRVRNGKIKRELHVALRYPTYREGISALAEAWSNSPENRRT